MLMLSQKVHLARKTNFISEVKPLCAIIDQEKLACIAVQSHALSCSNPSHLHKKKTLYSSTRGDMKGVFLAYARALKSIFPNIFQEIGVEKR